MAQQGSDPQPFDDLRARIEQQDQQIQALQAQMAGLQGTTATTTQTAYAPSGGGAVASGGGACPAYEVGDDLSVKATFKDGMFLWLETPNKDFTMHLGAWMQLDDVWFDESPALKAGAGSVRPGPVSTLKPPANGVSVSPASTAGWDPATGVLTGGIGNLQDGTYFRRVRPFAEGTFWETGEYRLILALENIQYDNTGFDEFWVGQKDLPVIGTVRIGHVKTPMGLEGDMTASSRCMTFMERSAYSASIEEEENFVTGLWASNNYLDQRVTWSAAIARADQGASSGDFFGDGQSVVQGRATCLPIYKDEGRELLHFGASGGWRNGQDNVNAGSGNYTGNTIELRSRQELRDDDPAGQNLPTNSDSSRMIDTGVLASNTQYLLGLESLYIHGPFSFQAEYGWQFVDNVQGVVNPSVISAVSGPVTVNTTYTPLIKFPNGPQNYVFSGGYLQVAYTLTGENRAYDKRIGTLAREYFGHQGGYEKAFLVRDENGRLCWGMGAWEVAARLGYVNLNDGAGFDRINGGDMTSLTLGLNWYVNNNLNVMFDYIYDYRYDIGPVTNPAGAVTTVVGPGHVQGIGTRVQFQF
jgi:phosphate-selective porin OprO/OprP